MAERDRGAIVPPPSARQSIQTAFEMREGGREGEADRRRRAAGVSDVIGRQRLEVESNCSIVEEDELSIGGVGLVRAAPREYVVTLEAFYKCLQREMRRLVTVQSIE